MGLDFTADNSPSFSIRKSDAPDGKFGPWEQITAHEAYSKIESAQYDEDEIYEIRVEPTERVEIPYVRWAYSGFSRFRVRLWDSIRQPDWPDMGRMQGFMPSTGIEIFRLREGHDPDPNSDIGGDYETWHGEQNDWWHLHATRWEDLPEHPLFPLLHHSDCDGDLSPELCLTIAPALRDAVATWDDEDYDKTMALLLAKAMDICAMAGRRLIFC